MEGKKEERGEKEEGGKQEEGERVIEFSKQSLWELEDEAAAFLPALFLLSPGKSSPLMDQLLSTPPTHALG